jgi:hypothetical protein
VYRTSQAVGDPGGPRLGLSFGASQAFDEPAGDARDPMLARHLADMLAQYGLTLREDVDVQSAGQSYGLMAGSLIAAALDATGDARTAAAPPRQPVDLLILAFAVADVAPGRSTAAFLASLCPGEPMAFAICDQGIAAPYTALRLLGATGDAADCRRALLVIAEQATAWYDPPAPVALPARHAAVVLGFDADARGGLGPGRQVRCADLATAGDLVSAVTTELAGGRRDVTLITGNGLGACDRLAVPASVQQLAAPEGQPCTGAWGELANGLGSWAAGGRRVLIADYEATLGYVCVAAIDVAATATRSDAVPCWGGRGSG